MSKTINLIVFNFQAIVIIVSFFFSLKLVNNKNIPGYMKGFYWYPTVGLIIAIPLFLTNNYFPIYKSFTSILVNISLIYHYSFLSIFILKVLPGKKKVKYFKTIFFTFLFFLIFTLVVNDLRKQINLAFSISNLGLTIFCIIFYYQLFNNIPTLDLKKEPSFWIVTGIFFCMSAHIPISAMIDYLHGRVSLFTKAILYNTILFCYIVMHLFFIKAYLCATHPQKA